MALEPLYQVPGSRLSCRAEVTDLFDPESYFIAGK